MSGHAAKVAPIATPAMDAFIARPVQLFEVPACDILRGVNRARREAARPKRLKIEGMLDRVDDLRDRLIGQLDTLDGDTDLEPFLSAMTRSDQSIWALGPGDDREEDADFEPSLSAGSLMDQRRWIIGGDTDAEAEHDGREPEAYA